MIVWTKPGDLILGRLDCEFYHPDYVAHEQAVSAASRAGNPAVEPIAAFAKLKAGPFGSKLPSAVYRSSGHPLFRVQNVLPFFPNETNLVFLDAETQRDLRASEVLAGQVLIAKAGRVGEACVVPEHYGPSNITEHVIALAPNADVDAHYVVAALNERFTNTQARRFGLGTIISYLGIEATRTIRMPLPSHNIQRAIGAKVRKAERLRALSVDIRSSAAREISCAYGPMPVAPDGEMAWVETSDLSDTRVDAWFHQPSYLAAGRLLDRRRDLVAVKTFSPVTTDYANVAAWPSEEFPYFEIGGLNAETGEAIPTQVRRDEAPSRAKYLVLAGDVLVSTVRPNLRSIAQVSTRHRRAVASSGFAVLRPTHPAIGAYVRACLVQDAATIQLMRWNTGGTYPAIERSVPGNVRVPDLGNDRVLELGEKLMTANQYTEGVADLLERAIANVEEIVAGNLDVSEVVDEGERIQRWLAANPSPGTLKETSHARNT